MNTSKKGVRLLAEICRQKAIRKVVFSPGSRSAPLVIAFSQIPEIECIVIPDERSAGYFALGMAQQLREIVAVVCTSGTAVLNLAPAVCEAYYQKVSLLILTADRPEGAEKKGDNQSINQDEIFGHFAVSISVNGDEEKKNTLAEKITRIIAEIQSPVSFPGHINIRLSEPLYEIGHEKMPEIRLPKIKFKESFLIQPKDKKRIKKKFEKFEKKMIIVGAHDCNSPLLTALKKLNQRNDLVIVHESLTNLKEINSIWNVDSCISLLGTKTSKAFIPDLVITLGNQIVSKKIKQFLYGKPALHWDVPIEDERFMQRNMFGDMLDIIEPVNEKQFLEILLKSEESFPSNYKKDWLSLSQRAEQKSKEYLSHLPFSDLKVFETLIKSFPDKANIQYGNSTPIRYSNFFEHKKSLSVNANRGTSGIDGCLSTAAGAAHANQRMTICVLGDISFFYDSNALWNNSLSPDFRIIIINNGGGNIFRMIDRATEVKGFEKFFETKHALSAKHVASMYGLPYYICDSQKGLDKILKTFYKPSDKPKILEIKTDGVLSAEVYKGYFEFLKQTTH